MIDWTKPLQTTHTPPCPARLLCSDLKDRDGRTHLVSACVGANEFLFLAKADGVVPYCNIRIVNAPQKHLVYTNVYRDADGLKFSRPYNTPQAAINAALGNPIAVAVPVEFTEGQS
jgi:hypothetical protein